MGYIENNVVFINVKNEGLMKKLLLAALLLIPTMSYASGPYDGIYTVGFKGVLSDYASVHEVNEQVVVIIVAPDPNKTWEPMIGTRNGSIVTLNHIPNVSPSDIQLNVTVDLNVMKITINSCVNGFNYICPFPTGITLDLNKIF